MKDVKVALINPGILWRGMEFVYEPIPLEYIASYLEKNHIEVKIIDEIAGQNVKKEIVKFNPDIVGLGANTLAILDAYRISDMCKGMGIRTVIGGVHASALPKEVLKHADIAVIGEGENAILKIIKKDIKSGIVSAPYIKNLDDIPMPARHLIDMDFYLEFITSICYRTPAVRIVKIGRMFSSRGCPYKCSFCCNSFMKTPLRFHSAERVVDEMKFLIDNYKVKHIAFCDDNFFTNKNRIERICKLMKENGIDIEWSCQSRVDNITLDFMKKIKKSGCRSIIFGFESGSQKILDVLNKGTNIKQNQKVANLCKKVGITPIGFFIIGNPTETIEDIETTMKFIEKNDNIFPMLHVLTPYPGTKFLEFYKKNNILSKNINWSKFISNRRLTFALSQIPKFSTHISIYNNISKNELNRIFNKLKLFEKNRMYTGIWSIELCKDLSKVMWLIKFGLKHPHTFKTVRKSFL